MSSPTGRWSPPGWAAPPVEEPGDPSEVRPVLYAYLVQTSLDGSRWESDRTEPSGGLEESTFTPRGFAQHVLSRRFLQLRADNPALWRGRWFRVDVWRVRRDPGEPGANGGPPGTAAARAEAETLPPRSWALSGRHLAARRIPPDVVEIRTPVQVREAVLPAGRGPRPPRWSP